MWGYKTNLTSKAGGTLYIWWRKVKLISYLPSLNLSGCLLALQLFLEQSRQLLVLYLLPLTSIVIYSLFLESMKTDFLSCNHAHAFSVKVLMTLLTLSKTHSNKLLSVTSSNWSIWLLHSHCFHLQFKSIYFGFAFIKDLLLCFVVSLLALI